MPSVRVGRSRVDAFVEHGLLVELVDIAEDESWFEAYSLGSLYAPSGYWRRS
jgi:hypothetical protein